MVPARGWLPPFKAVRWVPDTFYKTGPFQDTFWGLIQEFGAPEANVPALHWAENAAKEHQDEVLAVYYEALTEGIKDMKK